MGPSRLGGLLVSTIRPRSKISPPRHRSARHARPRPQGRAGGADTPGGAVVAVCVKFGRGVGAWDMQPV
jgi:hypothetical protein